MITRLEEISPINVPYLDLELSSKLEKLSSGFDIIYGMYDAAAFIRREEEKLIQSGNHEGERKAKLERRSEQQKSAIDKFLQRAAINQEIGKSIQQVGHLNRILEQFNKAIENLSNQLRKDRRYLWINPSKGPLQLTYQMKKEDLLHLSG